MNALGAGDVGQIQRHAAPTATDIQNAVFRLDRALAQWIVIRQAGSGDTPEGIVDRAQQFLAADRLADAIQELNRLPDAPKRVAQPWIRDAQRRLEIDTRITAIRQELSRS